MVFGSNPRQEVLSSLERATPARILANDADLEPSSGVQSNGWRSTLTDFAAQFESLVDEKRDLTFRLHMALDENLRLNQRHQQACDEFDGERTRLNSEIVHLRSQIDRQPQSLVAAKEKLVREEFERKFQELTLEVKQARSNYKKAVDEVKNKLEGCICGAKMRSVKQ